MRETVLAVKEVTVAFSGLAALQSVSLEVGRAEIVSLIGPNGAGKTTLFNVICGFVEPSEGHIEVGGERLHRHRPTDLARLGISRTVQGVGLWQGLSVLENVMAGGQYKSRAGIVSCLLGLPRSSREEARLRDKANAVLERFELSGYAGNLPASLPYGLRKKVALARALMLEPAILLLDEPAAGLDQSEMDQLAGLVGELRSTMSVVVVEHNMDFVMSISDRVVVLNFGEVIKAGTPVEVRADPVVADAYLGDAVAVGGPDAALPREPDDL